MNVWAKMITALRGGVNEAGEAVVDTQALRILDQEIRDASEELADSKKGLVSIIAREKVAKQLCKNLQEEITEHEGYALQAIEQGNDALAREVAEKIADLEQNMDTEKKTADGFAQSAKDLKRSISHAEQTVKHLKQQVDTVKATDSVQKAQATVSARYSGSESRVQTAIESLERIQESQKLNAAKMEASDELASELKETSLKDKLEGAGIISGAKGADDILERLKKGKKNISS